nr:phosphoribosylamine--glycine ligase [Lachnospiraceae bacterium]
LTVYTGFHHAYNVILHSGKYDIISVMEACIDGKLSRVKLEFEDNAAVCVVLTEDGYPVKYTKGHVITGLEVFRRKKKYFCFHAGTRKSSRGIVTNGGRVLGVTALGKDLKTARREAYRAAEWIQFEGKYMRHDIGKAIDEV